MKINKIKINNKTRPYIIAEISGNHQGSIKNAIKLINSAKVAGASAVKFQTFNLDEMTMNIDRREFFIRDALSLWNKRSLYSLYKEAYTPIEWHEELFNYCKKIGITCFSSVFDEKSLEILEKLNAPAYKIASFEINHLPLIEKIAQKKKPVIISTGMSNFKEIITVKKIFEKNNNFQFAFLKCTSSYPANPKESNLKAIKLLKKRLNCEIGLSDHTIGIGVSVASVALGASIIEKHIHLNKKKKSIDSHFSLSPEEFKFLVKECNSAWEALGKEKIGITKNEKKSLLFRRSIYITKDVKKNEKISEKNIKIIRPSLGLNPKYYYKILGLKFKKNYKKGMPLKQKYVQN